MNDPRYNRRHADGSVGSGCKGVAMATDVLPDDVANAEAEEAFETGVRQNAMEFDAHDLDGDAKLDFQEYCKLVREREEGEHDEATLRARFDDLDGDGSGKVDMHEYIRFALRDALARSSTRVHEIFEAWDEDGSGRIDQSEFRKAVRALGFNARDEDLDAVFLDFDVDGGGSIEYAELNKKLRQFSGIEAANRHSLRRVAGGRKGAGPRLSEQVLRSSKFTFFCLAAGFLGLRNP